jgi:hypothetical protein
MSTLQQPAAFRLAVCWESEDRACVRTLQSSLPPSDFARNPPSAQARLGARAVQRPLPSPCMTPLPFRRIYPPQLSQTGGDASRPRLLPPSTQQRALPSNPPRQFAPLCNPRSSSSRRCATPAPAPSLPPPRTIQKAPTSRRSAPPPRHAHQRLALRWSPDTTTYGHTGNTMFPDTEHSSANTANSNGEHSFPANTTANTAFREHCVGRSANRRSAKTAANTALWHGQEDRRLGSCSVASPCFAGGENALRGCGPRASGASSRGGPAGADRRGAERGELTPLPAGGQGRGP